MLKNEIMSVLKSNKTCSAWDRGVNEYAMELLNELKSEEITKENLLNGADSWEQYSYGGCSLIYDYEIAERLCTPSMLKKKKGGDLSPNNNEEWLDVQTRALFQACNRVLKIVRRNIESNRRTTL